jgi:glyoxylase-like metal-dependent hydrolase (beta-lactamase superfamily II)
MDIKRIDGGMFDSNCYLVYADGKGTLIDAGVTCERVISTAAQLSVKIENIILTHGHIDHIVELDRIVEKTNASVYIHADDEQFLTDPRLNASAYFGEPFSVLSRVNRLRDGSIITNGADKFTIIHTPGHTPGSICVLTGNSLLSGDTLFYGGYGRVDLPDGSFDDIYDSIVHKLFTLSKDIIVYPGHGERTKIGDEININPITYSTQW